MTKAIVYCEEAFNTPNGKTAHGLVRFTERYIGYKELKGKSGGVELPGHFIKFIYSANQP